MAGQQLYKAHGMTDSFMICGRSEKVLVSHFAKYIYAASSYDAFQYFQSSIQPASCSSAAVGPQQQLNVGIVKVKLVV